ncbi:MAG: MBL fold metallo-hydrolase [Candidatus Thermoplasmatota archaeon]|nr:MBL fold metallo-hydrolase [Candidatus Thermoplasmatota archaeon]
MSIEVHILGTSSARPTSIRQVSGSLISCQDGIAIVDAGEGFQSRFAIQRKRMKTYETYNLKSSKVSVLCLTHGHLDHTWGVLPWLQSMALDNRNQPLLVLGPTTNEVIDALLENQSVPDETPASD